MTECNGWTNYETWLVAVWFGDSNELMNKTPDELKEGITEDVALSLSNHTDSELGHGFAYDLLRSALDAVNWSELSEYYVEEDEE